MAESSEETIVAVETEDVEVDEVVVVGAAEEVEAEGRRHFSTLEPSIIRKSLLIPFCSRDLKT